MRAAIPQLRHMPIQVTINAATAPASVARVWRPAAVIIGGVCGLLCAGAFAAQSSLLTTTAPALTTVVVDGSSIYGLPQLFAAYRQQLAQPITVDAARTIVAALADLYVRDGYVKPELVVDDALAGQGVLRVRVHEAQITNVIFEGDGGRFRDALDAIGARLENARPLRRNDVPQALRDMRQIAGLAVTATTRRDAKVRNAFELVVRAEFSPIDGVVRMNNRGTDEVGPAFLLGQVFANGLLGRGEKIGLIFAAANDHEEYLGGGLYFDAPFGAGGARANALLFRSHSAPNEAPVDLDDQYTRQRVTLGVSRPLRQDSTLVLVANGTLDADDLTIDSGGVSFREDRLRILDAGVRASWNGKTAMQYSVNLRLRKGLDAFGAGLQALDLLDDPRRADFTVALLQGSSSRRFAEHWSVRFDGFSQYTHHVLPDTERFKIGGDRLGRGFEVAEIAGDSGLGGKIELRRDLVNTETSFGRVSAYGFYDFGAAWKNDVPGRESAATAGSGVAISGGTLTGYLEVAAPLTGPDIEGKRKASVFAELSYRF
jgi:hemolysin activation/secretion protein